MKTIRVAFFGALMVFGAAMGLAGEARAEKKLCIVCAVKEGSDHLEEVKAERMYEGVKYYFCARDCAMQFDADPAAFVPPTLPRPAPAIALKDLAGKPLNWSALKGQVVLLDFWATWCAPCKKSMPELQALHEKYGKRGFTVVGISLDEDGPAKVKKFVKEKKYTYRMAMDATTAPFAWEAYKVKSVPAAFLVDAEGRIVAQWTGRAPTGAEVEEKVEALLGKREG